MSISAPISTQKVDFKQIEKYNVNLKMARLDQNNKLASGNKIYKLNPIFDYIKTNDINQILSFGGAFSNHIHALALLAKQNDVESIGLIRGEAEYAQNPTLSDARNAGMKLEFVSRAEYKQRNDKQYLQLLQKRYPDALIVAEGGSSQLAIQGCSMMASDLNLIQQSDIFAIASGTGATAAGLACGLLEDQHLNVYSVLKDDSLKARIDGFIHAELRPNKSSNYKIQEADFGGYAKFDIRLLEFILSWLEETGILLDPIYTSKMCRKVIQQIEAGEFSSGQSITLIHTGGLQGWRGMQQRVEALSGTQAWQKISDYLDGI